MRKVAWFLHALDVPRGHEIADELIQLAAEARFPVLPRITWAKPGQFEELTLNKIREWSIENPGYAVLYCHTKGAYHVFSGTDQWRRCMADRLIGAWPPRLKELADHDTTGVHYFTEAEFGREIVGVANYYAGNFWWANSDYLATLSVLPELNAEDRGEAEVWIGRGNPNWHALETGWPNPSIMTCVRPDWSDKKSETVAVRDLQPGDKVVFSPGRPWESTVEVAYVRDGAPGKVSVGITPGGSWYPDEDAKVEVTR